MQENLPYLFVYKTGVFPFQNNPQNLDSSYKTNLDFGIVYKTGLYFLDLFSKRKQQLITEFHKLI